MKIYYHRDRDGNSAAIAFLYFLTGAYGVHKKLWDRKYRMTREQIELEYRNSSRAIVEKNILSLINTEEYDKIELYEIDYSPKCFEMFKFLKGETVVLLDISFKESDKKLFDNLCKNAAYVFWIDHHKSSEDFVKNCYGSFTKCPASCGGVYNVPGISAAELTYVYLKGLYDYLDEQPEPTFADFKCAYNNMAQLLSDPSDMKDMIIHASSPKLLKIISDSDTRSPDNYVYPETSYIAAALENFKVADDLNPEYVSDEYLEEHEMDALYVRRSRILDSFSSIFNKNQETGKDLMFDYLEDMPGTYTLDKVIKKGRILYDENSKMYVSKLSDFSYERIWKDKKCLVINERSRSAIFETVIAKYEMCIMWSYQGDCFKYSLFSKNSDIDCSEIAKEFGGGGHAGAAGFTVKEVVADLL